MRLDSAVDEYLTGARQEGKSPTTVRHYRWHLNRLVRWLGFREAVELAHVTRSLLRMWGADLREVWAPATIKQATCAARSFFAWCTEEGWLEENPALALRVPPVPRRVQRTLSDEEVRAMLRACDDSPKGRRDAALVSLLLDSGLRASEVCRLAVEDLDLEEGLLVVQIKGGDQGVGYFGDATVRRLRRWLAVRPSEDGVRAVFVSLGGNTPGRPVTVSGLRLILRRLGEQAGVEGVSTHAFRRSFAVIATQAGAPSRLVQQLGRWSDIEMVEHYTQGLEARRLYRRYSPGDYLEEVER